MSKQLHPIFREDKCLFCGSDFGEYTIATLDSCPSCGESFVVEGDEDGQVPEDTYESNRQEAEGGV